MNLSISRKILLAVMLIPTHESGSWILQSYSSIPRNEVDFSNRGILVKVNSSASPLIFPFKDKESLSGFRVAGEFRGLPKFADPSSQGKKGFDDFPLRLGFVVSGKKQLGTFQKLVAKDWVRRLFSLAPEGEGVDKILFFNITQNPHQVGGERTHPMSELIRETFIDSVKEKGEYSYSYTFKAPIEVLAIWISIDGDDTKSAFDVLIRALEVTKVDQNEK